jgi:hypothetical protein
VFVVGQSHGTWGKAREVPGTAALNHGGDASGPDQDIGASPPQTGLDRADQAEQTRPAPRRHS